MSPTLSEVLPIAKCSRDDFQNWRRRDGFSTELPPTKAGVAQELTRENALELSFVSVLTSAGYEPAEAKREAARWVKEEAQGTLAQAWATNPLSARRLPGRIAGVRKAADRRSLSADAINSLWIDLPDQIESGWVGEADKNEAQRATALVLIDRAEIVRRVDQLFADAAADQLVVTFPARPDLVALAAVERVVARLPEQDVVARAAVEHVRAAAVLIWGEGAGLAPPVSGRVLRRSSVSAAR